MKNPFDEIINILDKLSDEEKEVLIDNVQNEMDQIEKDLENVDKVKTVELPDGNRCGVINLSTFMTSREIEIFNYTKHIIGIC